MYMPGKQITESNIKLIGGSQSLSPAQKSPAKRSSLEARKHRDEYNLKNRLVDLQDKELAIKEKEVENARKRDSDDHRRRMKALEIEDKKTADENKRIVDDRIERTMRFNKWLWAAGITGAVVLSVFLLLVYTGKFEIVAKNVGLKPAAAIGTGIVGIIKIGKELQKFFNKRNEKKNSDN